MKQFTLLRHTFIVLVLVFSPIWGLHAKEVEGEQLLLLKRYLAERNYEKAKEIVYLIESKDEFCCKYEFYKSAGELYMKLERYKKAVEYFTLANINAKDNREREYTILKRAECAYYLRNFSEAKLYLKNLLKNFPKTVYINDAYLLLAQTCEALGEGREAIYYYQKVQPTLSAQIVKAKAYVRLKSFDDAIKIFEGIVKTERELLAQNQDIYYYFGEALRNKGRLKEAKVYLSAARRLKDYSDKAGLSLGLIAYEERNFEEAISYFKEVRMGKDREAIPVALYYLGKISLEKGNSEEAREHFLSLRNNYPVAKEYKLATYELIKVYRERGEFDKSFSYLDELLKEKDMSDMLLSEIEANLEKMYEKNAKDFVNYLEKYRVILFKGQRYNALYKFSEKLGEQQKVSLLEKLFIAGTGNLKKDCASKLYTYYMQRGKVDKALQFLNFIDKEMVEKFKLYDYLIAKDFEKAMGILEKIENPSLEDIENLIYLERLYPNKKRVVQLFLKWLGKGLKIEDCIKIGNYFYGKDRKLAELAYSKAIKAMAENDEKRKDLETKLNLIKRKEDRAPFVIEGSIKEQLKKVEEQEKRVNKIVGGL